MSNSIVKASEVTGVKVKNGLGEHLGVINELVLDKALGKVNYVVLDFGGFLSMGNKFFALPWHLFSYDVVQDYFVLNVSKDRLKNAPGFDKDNWPNFASPEITSSLHNFYE